MSVTHLSDTGHHVWRAARRRMAEHAVLSRETTPTIAPLSAAGNATPPTVALFNAPVALAAVPIATTVYAPLSPGTRMHDKAELDAAYGSHGRFLTVEDFGAVGDGTTDDSAAFNAYAAYIRASTAYQPQRTLVLSANRSYLVSNPLDFNLFYPYRVTVLGNGSSIVGAVGATGAIISAMASFVAFRDLRIFAQGPCLYGIQIGLRSSAGSDDQPCRMDGVEIYGTFVNACLYNRGAEDSSFNDCKFQNYQDGGYPLIMDGCVHWPIDQTTIGDTLYTGSTVPVSFNAQTFVNSIVVNQVQTGTTNAAVWMGGSINRHNYVACYAQVGSASPLVVLYVPDDIMTMNGMTWDVHGETLPSCMFFITGPYATPVLGELQLWDHYNQVAANGSTFKLDTTITSCTLRNLDYRVPAHYQSGVTLFDQPAKYTVSGTVEVPALAAFNNPASFSGLLLTGTSVLTVGTTAEADQTLSANGQTVAVPLGYSSVTVQSGAANLTGLILAKGQTPGQRLVVVNHSANTLTFDAAYATSNVFGGPTIAAYTAKQFYWDAYNTWWPM